MATVDPISNGKDSAGSAMGIRNAPGWVDAEILSATNVSHAVPSGANWVVFSSTGPFFAKPNGAAVVPVGAVTDGSASELSPAAWQLRPLGYDGPKSSGVAITTIGLISSGTPTVTLSFYKNRPSGF